MFTVSSRGLNIYFNIGLSVADETSSRKVGSTIPRKEETQLIRAPVLVSQEAVVAYASIIDGMTRKHFEKEWFGKKEVEFFKLLQLLTVAISTRLFIGLIYDHDEQRVAKLANWFGHIAQGLNALPYDIPGFSVCFFLFGDIMLFFSGI